MKHIGRGILVALMLVATLSGCAMTSIRQHPDFASGKRKINVVAILPVEAEYRHLVFTGENERDPKREKEIASEIESTLMSALKWHGYTAKLDVVTKAQSGDKEFNFQIEQLRNAYGEAAKELYARAMVEEGESTKFKVGVGPLANSLAAVAGADALMIVNYQGFDKSSGLMAKEITSSVLLGALTGVYYAPAPTGGRVELSLIDGVSGDVLWSNAWGGAASAANNLSTAIARLPVAPAVGRDVAGGVASPTATAVAAQMHASVVTKPTSDTPSSAPVSATQEQSAKASP